MSSTEPGAAQSGTAVMELCPRRILAGLVVALAVHAIFPSPSRADTSNPFVITIPLATVATVGVGGLVVGFGNIGDAISDDPGETCWRTWGWVFATGNFLAAAGSYLLGATARYDQGYGLVIGTLHTLIGALDVLAVLTNQPEVPPGAAFLLTPAVLLDRRGEVVAGLSLAVVH